MVILASSLWEIVFAGQEAAEGVDHPSQRHPKQFETFGTSFWIPEPCVGFVAL
jgi:hypothetical protein